MNRDDWMAWLEAETPHYECEDCWYSCATICCDEHRRSDQCDCGADFENAAKRAVLEALRASQSEAVQPSTATELAMRDAPTIYEVVMRAMRDHYWDSLESQKDLVLKHIEGTMRSFAPEAVQPVPEGWKLVPVEPTEEMVYAGGYSKWAVGNDGDGIGMKPDVVYRAMLAASPSEAVQRDAARYGWLKDDRSEFVVRDYGAGDDVRTPELDQRIDDSMRSRQ